MKKIYFVLCFFLCIHCTDFFEDPAPLELEAIPKGSEGPFTSPLKVKLESNHSDATIYYTTNGSKPNTESDEYNGPITLKSNTTLKFYAVKTVKKVGDQESNEETDIFTESYVVTGGEEETSTETIDFEELTKSDDSGTVSGEASGVEEDEEDLTLSTEVKAKYTYHGANWNDYVKRSDPDKPLWQQPDTECDVETQEGAGGCFHGGEIRKVYMTGHSSCEGVTASDSLDVFSWICDDSAAFIAIISTGLKAGKGLRDLLTPNGWKAIQLYVKQNGEKLLETAPAKWWENTVEPLPENTGKDKSPLLLEDESVIYTLAEHQNTRGYNINADKVAIVTLGDSILTYIRGEGHVIYNCDALTGEMTPQEIQAGNEDWVGRLVTICAGSQKYLWLEVDIDFGDDAIRFHKVTFSTIRNTLAMRNMRHGILLDRSDNNRLINVNMAWWGNYLHLRDSHRNYLSHISVTHAQGNLVQLEDSYNNILTGIFVARGTNGIYVGGNNNTLSHITGSGNMMAGVNIAGSANTLIQALTFQGQAGVEITGSDAIVAQTLSANNWQNISVGIKGSLSLEKDILLGKSYIKPCLVSDKAENPGLSDETCETETTATLHLDETLDIANSFVGQIEEDKENGKYYEMSSKNSNLRDFVHFENPYRHWGHENYLSIVEAATAVGHYDWLCIEPESCKLFDWRLKSSDETIKGRSNYDLGEMESFQVGETCPQGAHGDLYFQDRNTPINTFLINAVEKLGDGKGDDDGLCESSESCIYSPNYGRYQGEGSLSEKTCEFQAGQITDVKLYGFLQNGAED